MCGYNLQRNKQKCVTILHGQNRVVDCLPGKAKRHFFNGSGKNKNMAIVAITNLSGIILFFFFSVRMCQRLD